MITWKKIKHWIWKISVMRNEKKITTSAQKQSAKVHWLNSILSRYLKERGHDSCVRWHDSASFTGDVIYSYYFRHVRDCSSASRQSWINVIIWLDIWQQRQVTWWILRKLVAVQPSFFILLCHQILQLTAGLDHAQEGLNSSKECHTNFYYRHLLGEFEADRKIFYALQTLTTSNPSRSPFPPFSPQPLSKKKKKKNPSVHPFPPSQPHLYLTIPRKPKKPGDPLFPIRPEHDKVTEFSINCAIEPSTNYIEHARRNGNGNGRENLQEKKRSAKRKDRTGKR